MSAARLAKAAIKIPKRIERGPTDILKALASTVKYFPGGPTSLLHDDPYLLPSRPSHHELYSMAKLTGKSTAKFLLSKYPELFFRDDSEPKVRSFLPPEEFREDMLFTEDDIIWCIDNYDPVNGIVAYNTLEKNNIKLSDGTLLDFFEMICFTNEEQIKDIIDSHKNFFSRDASKLLVQQTWSTNGLASKIFNQIKEDLDPPRVYSAMIAGLSKYNDHAAARQVFDDFREHHANDGLYACAYDGLLNSIPKLNSSIDTAHAAVEEIVQHMEAHLVKPNLGVFNSILTVYKSFFCDEHTCTKAIKLVNDMRILDIKPSLYTYICIIGVINRSRQSLASYAALVPELLDYIISQDELDVRDSRDLESLNLGMRLISTNMHNLAYANKLHKIYLKRPNLFLNKVQQSRYLDDYFKLIITTDKLENIIDFYTTYVPTRFGPSADTYQALVEAIDLYQADPKIVKMIGEDIVEFGLADKIKNDEIFRKDPDYVELILQRNMPRREREDRQRELSSVAEKGLD